MVVVVVGYHTKALNPNDIDQPQKWNQNRAISPLPVTNFSKPITRLWHSTSKLNPVPTLPWVLLKTSYPFSIAPNTDPFLEGQSPSSPGALSDACQREDFTPLGEKQPMGAVIAVPQTRAHCFLRLHPYITTGSSQLLPWCQTYILSKETADRTTCCFLCSSPCVSLLFPTSLGLLKTSWQGARSSSF